MAPRKPKGGGARGGPQNYEGSTTRVPQEPSSTLPPAVSTRSSRQTQLQSLHPWEGGGFGKPEPGRTIYTSANMASRSRPRGGQPRDNSLDAHEETNMWNKIMQDLRDKAKPNNDRQRELAKQITEMEEAISKKSARKSDFIFCIEGLRIAETRLQSTWRASWDSKVCCSLIIHIHLFTFSSISCISPNELCTCSLLYWPVPKLAFHQYNFMGTELAGIYIAFILGD